MNDQALLLRLAACEINAEAHGVHTLRHILRLRGWSDATMDEVVARLRACVGLVQSRFDVAA